MHVLITGATGFIGSSLAASLLDRGARVTCLARGSDGAQRARAEIMRAAAGFGLRVDARDAEVLPHDLAALESDHAQRLRDLDAVWHCAAHMTFSMRRLREAIDTNVGGTVALAQLLARVCAGRARLYFCSTAYTGGVESQGIVEDVHLAPHLVNPYFVSKWSAELVLEKLARSGLLPVSVWRPTIVIGHAETGWYGGQSYGLYNFLDAVFAGQMAGGRSLRLDISPSTLHNYVTIDDVTANAVALTETTKGREPFEVFIADGTDNPNSDRVEWIAEGMNVELSFGRPRTIADHALDYWITVNKPFNQPAAGVRPFPFQSGKLAALLGSNYQRHDLGRDVHLTLIRWYRANRLAEIEASVLAQPSVRTVRLAQRTRMDAMLPKRPAGGLVMKAVARAHGLKGFN